MFQPEGGRFRVELPGEPAVERDERRTPAGPARETRYVLQHGDAELAAETHDIPPLGAALMPAGLILDQAARGVIEAKGGTPLAQREISVQGAPAREFTYRVAGEPVRYGLARTILVGSRIFLLTGTSPAEPGDHAGIARFLGSFEFFPEPAGD